MSLEEEIQSFIHVRIITIIQCICNAASLLLIINSILCYNSILDMNIKEIGQDILDKVHSLSDKALERIPEEKRRFIIFISGGILFLAICLVIITLGFGRRTTENPQISSAGISADELFYPGEPDFLPSLLLEREPHQPWTLDDLELFWQDPKAGNEEKWREVIITTVDRLLDGVP